MHFTSRFRLEKDGNKLTLEYLDHPAKGVRRVVTFATERGSYRFERATPVGRETTVCRRRLTFGEFPFPPDTANSTGYYSDGSKE